MNKAKKKLLESILKLKYGLYYKVEVKDINEINFTLSNIYKYFLEVEDNHLKIKLPDKRKIKKLIIKLAKEEFLDKEEPLKVTTTINNMYIKDVFIDCKSNNLVIQTSAFDKFKIHNCENITFEGSNTIRDKCRINCNDLLNINGYLESNYYTSINCENLNMNYATVKFGDYHKTMDQVNINVDDNLNMDGSRISVKTTVGNLNINSNSICLDYSDISSRNINIKSNNLHIKGSFINSDGLTIFDCKDIDADGNKFYCDQMIIENEKHNGIDGIKSRVALYNNEYITEIIDKDLQEKREELIDTLLKLRNKCMIETNNEINKIEEQTKIDKEKIKQKTLKNLLNK